MTAPAEKNGCFDRAPYKQLITLRDHHDRDVSCWPFVMAQDCQYTKSELGQADKRCTGCKWRKESTA